MALASSVVTVGTSPVALNSAGPTRITIFNLDVDSIKLGASGAGNQNLPLAGGSQITLDIAGTDVVYALAQAAGHRVAVLSS